MCQIPYQSRHKQNLSTFFSRRMWCSKDQQLTLSKTQNWVCIFLHSSITVLSVRVYVVSVPMGIHVCTYVATPLCMCMWRPKVNFNSIPLYLLTQGGLQNVELTDFSLSSFAWVLSPHIDKGKHSKHWKILLAPPLCGGGGTCAGASRPEESRGAGVIRGCKPTTGPLQEQCILLGADQCPTIMLW